jgi:uncharacterized protein YegJ (DUF2314 family)
MLTRLLKKLIPGRRHPVPPGSLMEPHIVYQFALYYLPLPSNEPVARLQALLQERFDRVHLVPEIAAPAAISVAPYVLERSTSAYRPPDPQYLQYFGHGLNKRQVEDLQGSQQAVVLSFGYPRAHLWEGLRNAVALTSALARWTGGLIWDAETREIFTPQAWEERRLAGWTDPPPDVAAHTTIHAYNQGEFVRAITLGMRKFGLPDVVVNDFSWALNRNVGHLVNLLAQALAEGATIEEAGTFELDLHAIRNDPVREAQLEMLGERATATAMLGLYRGTPEKGDPQNRLIEIEFEHYPGPDRHARQEKMLSSLFGWEDALTPIQHDEALLAASQRAREKLPTLRAAFREGLAPGEFIQVKAPFKTPEGSSEWMWVEVISWKGNKIRGLLRNQPFNIPDLQAGQKVEILEEKVFDYMRRFPDGRLEGNETGKLIEEQRQ